MRCYYISLKIQRKVAWNLKGAGITGYSASAEELKVLQDVVYSTAVQTGSQKASYIVQFLWRDLTSGFDLIGPYFLVESSMSSNVLQELIMLCLEALSSYGFKVSILLWDGESSNLTVLKLLSGNPKAQFPMNSDAEKTPKEHDRRNFWLGRYLWQIFTLFKSMNWLVSWLLLGIFPAPQLLLIIYFIKQLTAITFTG